MSKAVPKSILRVVRELRGALEYNAGFGWVSRVVNAERFPIVARAGPLPFGQLVVDGVLPYQTIDRGAFGRREGFSPMGSVVDRDTQGKLPDSAWQLSARARDAGSRSNEAT